MGDWKQVNKSNNKKDKADNDGDDNTGDDAYLPNIVSPQDGSATEFWNQPSTENSFEALEEEESEAEEEHNVGKKKREGCEGVRGGASKKK